MRITKTQLSGVPAGVGVGIEKKNGTRYAGRVVKHVKASRAHGEQVVIDRVAGGGRVTVELLDIASAHLMDLVREQVTHEAR